MKNSFQKGVSLYLAIIVMFLLLAMALGLSGILFSQLKIVKGMENSVIAFYGADTGIERVLYAIRKEGYIPQLNEEPCDKEFDCQKLENGATYIIKISPNSTSTISSNGNYKKVNRAIEITY